jgi:hypothetical protein
MKRAFLIATLLAACSGDDSGAECGLDCGHYGSSVWVELTCVGDPVTCDYTGHDSTNRPDEMTCSFSDGSEVDCWWVYDGRGDVASIGCEGEGFSCSEN